MIFRLPPSLQADSDDCALAQLRGYFGPSFDSPDAFTGAAFDDWDSTGTREADRDRFTADDLVAITFLSVRVKAPAAHRLLRSEDAHRFNAFLAALGADRDFADLAPEELTPEFPAWVLEQALRGLPGVGRTVASKLLARKRPRLVPIYDKVVGRVMCLEQAHWLPLNAALRANGHALQQRLLALRDAAGLPPSVSALRVLDVIAWRDGKDLGY